MAVVICTNCRLILSLEQCFAWEGRRFRVSTAFSMHLLHTLGSLLRSSESKQITLSELHFLQCYFLFVQDWRQNVLNSSNSALAVVRIECSGIGSRAACIFILIGKSLWTVFNTAFQQLGVARQRSHNVGLQATKCCLVHRDRRGRLKASCEVF